ncbi:cupin domain-containing protein [Streptomyces sp. NBC_01485]|uniref:cupin domain-containing protein n=1 Tax=Streptomyces sp. NBC_01485 TaxID=2903884 RepID=UPI002E35B548|nr:cupin domain-containing protein [Streptomyces sp. NBC_01485]
MSGDSYRVLSSVEETNGAIGFVDATVPPGGGPIAHTHERTDESFFLISGTVAFLDEEENFTAEAGSFIHVPRGRVHRFMNIGDEDARIALIFNPAGMEQLFLFGGDLPAPGGKPVVWGAERFAEALEKTAALDIDAVMRPDLEVRFRPERN